MAVGLQIFDASGNIVLDATHRVMRLIGSFTLDGTNGSKSDPNMVSGGWVSFQPDRYIGYLSGGTIHPQFSFNNGTLSWSYSPKNSAQYDEYVTGVAYFGAY